VRDTIDSRLKSPDGVDLVEAQIDDASGLRVGIVVSRFNPQIGEAMLFAASAELKKMHLDSANGLLVIIVPGALEIPIAMQQMAASANVDAIIALGSVIRGDTYHFEVVANESCRGVMQVQLKYNIPIANGILTVDSSEQAWSRMEHKAASCARTVVEMCNLLRKLAKA